MLDLFSKTFALSFSARIALLSLIAVLVLIAVLFTLHRVLRNPFHYPYFTHSFDVSNKRNIHIEDYIDRYLCDVDNWEAVKQHEDKIEQWKCEKEEYLKKCRLKRRRMMQYRQVLDDEHAFQFRTVRSATRYRQHNYIKTSYQIRRQDNLYSVSWRWLEDRHKQLNEIGFEASLRDYHSKNQRKLMSKALRKQIMERDNYTCQSCGKYMPDEVGLQIDHITPIARGGKTVYSNLQVLCSKCNGSKSAK